MLDLTKSKEQTMTVPTESWLQGIIQNMHLGIIDLIATFLIFLLLTAPFYYCLSLAIYNDYLIWTDWVILIMPLVSYQIF